MRGMKRSSRRLGGGRAAVLAGIIALAGCASDIDRLKTAEPRGPAYAQALARDYQAYVAHQVAQDNWRYADYFAKKGMEAANGVAVPPEEISKWDIPEDKRESVAGYRQRLMAALDGGARVSKPAEAAQAQVNFDCWLQELAENNIPETHAWIAGSDVVVAAPDQYSVAACKSQFLTQLARLEAK